MKTRQRGLLLLGGVAAVLAIREAHWWITAEDAAPVDRRAAYRAVAARGQPPGPDGYPHLVRAMEDASAVFEAVRLAYQEAPQDRPGGFAGYPDFSAVGQADLDASHVAPERDGLARLEEAGVFAALDELAACPRVSRPLPDSPGPLILAVESMSLSEARMLARACVAQMRLAALDGDDDARLRAFERTVALGRAVAYQPTLIDRIVGGAIMMQALREVRAQIGEGLFADSAVGHAHLDVMTRHVHLPPASRALEIERMHALDVTDWGFSDDGHGDGRLDLERLARVTAWTPTATPPPPSLPQRIASIFFTGKAETRARIDAAYDDLVEHVDKPAAVRAAAGFDPDAFAASLTFRDVFLRMTTISISSLLHSNDHMLGAIEASRLLLAIETYRAERGTPPPDLAALVPDYLPALPHDPQHGGSFVYRVDANGSVQVLSTGLDGVEDSTADPELTIMTVRDGDPRTEGIDILYDTTRE